MSLTHVSKDSCKRKESSRGFSHDEKILPYIEKVFDFRKLIHKLRDRRKWAFISTLSIWCSVFFSFVMRQRSLNAIEQKLKLKKRMERLIGKVKPSADRIGDVMGLIEPEQLRDILLWVNRCLRANKAFERF